jgi:hypothetical protein
MRYVCLPILTMTWTAFRHASQLTGSRAPLTDFRGACHPRSAYCHSMKTIRISILSALASAAIFAQTPPPPRVEFEVASVRPSDPILRAADASKLACISMVRRSISASCL